MYNEIIFCFYINSYTGTTIPTLYETVKTLKQLDMFMFLELKSGDTLVRCLTPTMK